MTNAMTPETAAALRKPFDAEVIGKLPRGVTKGDTDRGECKQGSKYSADGHYCGGWHARSVHLDYVGHAAITDRLLQVDPEWTWEPLAFDQTGLPAHDSGGNLWIKLTICGVTRLGVGDGASEKERIGDALRNAAMRFGVALDLWAKDGTETEPATRKPRPRSAKPIRWGDLQDAITDSGLDQDGVLSIASDMVGRKLVTLAALADQAQVDKLTELVQQAAIDVPDGPMFPAESKGAES